MRILRLGFVCAAISAGAAWAQDGVKRLHEPSLAEKTAVWPKDAAGQPHFGAAKVDCFIKADGALEGCTVAEEEPNGQSIGEAALKLAPQYRVQASDKALKLADGRVRVEITLRYDTPAVLVKYATPAQIRAVYPKEAGGGDGKAVIGCTTDPSKSLKNCEILSEAPAGAGFGKAALGLVGAYLMKPALANGKPVASPVQFPINFTQAVVTNPDWIRKPNLNQLLAVYPAKAHGDGRAIINCTVGVDGVLRNCKVLDETPTNVGFGQAALALAPSFLMKPGTKDGKPVSDEVTIPIKFTGFSAISLGDKVTVVEDPPWLTVPTFADIADGFPAGARGKMLVGAVVFQCDLTKVGRLRDCAVLNSDPPQLGFENSARKLLGKFTVDPAWMALQKGDLKVNFRVGLIADETDFWQGRTVGKISWNRTIDFEKAQALYPAEAATAGIESGLAKVTCTLAASGALSDCTVQSESVANMGFGQAALRIAQAFVANPWTGEGFPVEGGRITLPIKMVHDASDVGPATPATKP
jgi:TonB family protein